MGKVDTSALETLSAQLEGLPARTTLTPYELVKKLAPMIGAAHARGQDFAAIGALLAGVGVRLKPATIRNYLWRATREARDDDATVSAEAPQIVREPAAPPPVASPPVTALSPVAQARLAGRKPSVQQAGRFELVEDKEV